MNSALLDFKEAHRKKKVVNPQNIAEIRAKTEIILN